VTRFQFVADHHDTTSSPRPGWTVKRLCALLDVRRSSFYAWLKAAPGRAARAAADAALAARIRAVHDDRTCGRPRITAELNDQPGAERVNHKRVGRVMAEHGITGYRRRRRVRTTIPAQTETAVPDLLGRDFTADAPNRVYGNRGPLHQRCRGRARHRGLQKARGAETSDLVWKPTTRRRSHLRAAR